MHFRVLLGVFCVLVYAGLAYASPFAYVANNGNNTVTVLDTATNTVVGNPVPVGQGPYGVAVNQQGSRVYVSNQIDKTISVIDTAMLPYTVTSPVIATIPLLNKPGGLAVNAAGTRLFVTLSDGAGVDIYNTLTNQKVTSVTVANNPTGIAAVQAVGTYKVLVSNLGSASVSVINADDNLGTYAKAAADVALPVGSDPKGVAITSNGLYAYVANGRNNNISKIDVTTGLIVGTPITVGSGPTGVAITPDNATLYVSNTSSGTVTSCNLATLATTTFSLDGISGSNPMYGPYGIAVGPAGLIYTANNTTNNVSVMTPAGTISAGPVAAGIAPTSLGKFIGPLLHPIAVTITTGYGGSILPAADSLVSLNPAGTSVLVADGKSLTMNIVPDHNFVTAAVSVDGAALAQPLPASYTFSNVTTDTRSIASTFSRAYWDLTVTKNQYGGDGTGTVTATPGGINCGPADLFCGQTASIPVGASVTLTAAANTADGSEFISWGGAFCAGNTATCVIPSMSYDTTVNAHFVKKLTGPVRRGRATPAYSQTLEDAYANAANGDVIDMLTLNGANPFTLTNGFNLSKSVVIEGGWTEFNATAPDYGLLPAGSATTILAPTTGTTIGVVVYQGTVTIGSSKNGAVIIK